VSPIFTHILTGVRWSQNYLALKEVKPVVGGLWDNLYAIAVAVLGIVVDEALSLKLCLFVAHIICYDQSTIIEIPFDHAGGKDRRSPTLA